MEVSAWASFGSELGPHLEVIGRLQPMHALGPGGDGREGTESALGCEYRIWRPVEIMLCASCCVQSAPSACVCLWLCVMLGPLQSLVS